MADQDQIRYYFKFGWYVMLGCIEPLTDIEHVYRPIHSKKSARAISSFSGNFHHSYREIPEVMKFDK